MNADPVRIVQLTQRPEFLDTVVDWVVTQWRTSSPDEFEQTLVENGECPGALVAVSNDLPVAALAYKLHPLAQRDPEELWVNALYVATPWRGRGVGSRLVQGGVQAAVSLGWKRLYVYTDIPAFYERLGWQRFSCDENNVMHVPQHESANHNSGE